MDWRDDGVLLAARPHGETAAIIEVFTETRGRATGLVRGGASRKRAADLQPGTQVSVAWRGRLDGNLGVFTVEPLKGRAGRLLDDADALAALAATCALLTAFLPERDPQPALYGPTLALLDALEIPENWPTIYAHWELLLLETLGFGLDLSACAATGGTQNLIYVSPRSGRAVSAEAGAPYADRLLPLPAFLRLGEAGDPGGFAQALRLSGFFLERWAAAQHGFDALPAPRRRLDARARRRAEQTEQVTAEKTGGNS